MEWHASYFVQRRNLNVCKNIARHLSPPRKMFAFWMVIVCRLIRRAAASFLFSSLFFLSFLFFYSVVISETRLFRRTTCWGLWETQLTETPSTDSSCSVWRWVLHTLRFGSVDLYSRAVKITGKRKSIHCCLCICWTNISTPSIGSTQINTRTKMSHPLFHFSSFSF